MSSKSGIESRSFTGTSGGTEHFITIEAQGGLDLHRQIEQIERRYDEAQGSLGLAAGTAIFRRIFISDAMNQAAIIRDSALVRTAPEGPVAVSLIQQAPMPGAKIALLAYHVDGGVPTSKRRLSPRHLLVERNGQRHLWTTGLCAGECSADASPSVHTSASFCDLTGIFRG